MEEQRDIINRAAELILAADYMIVATGAGLSADSGLPVYKDTQMVEAYQKRKLSYIDICTPKWNFKEPETFYGFWGSSLKQFREAVPHTGYEILKKWRDQLFSEFPHEFTDACAKQFAFENVVNPPGPFFVYTSNVDAMHLKAGFIANEIVEIHGNIETWQCSKMCTKESWSAPPDFVFKVDLETMLAAEEEGDKKDFKKNNGFISNHPKCINCGGYARPAILMFGDGKWVGTNTLWPSWQIVVEGILNKNPNSSIVIVEIGCGKNVPSVRYMSERMVSSHPQQANVIRINRDYIKHDFTMYPERILGIQGTGKAILQAIDDVIQKHMTQSNKEEEREKEEKEKETQKEREKEKEKDAEDDDLAYEMKVRATLNDD